MVERMKGRVSEGMLVKSADGEKLGKVVACQPSGFVVEKGFLFPRDILVPYERISGVSNGEVLISLARSELGETGTARAATGTARSELGRAAEEVKSAAQNAAQNLKEAVTGNKETVTGNHDSGSKGMSLDTFGTAGVIRVPLVEEQLVASKHVEKVGEIHVRKEIITEEKQVTLPVMREVIRVEMVPVGHDATAADRPFETASYDIPIREEHVTVEKRAFVREELRVGKEIQRGEETASATVRREHVDVETLGPVRHVEEASNDTLKRVGGGTSGTGR